MYADVICHRLSISLEKPTNRLVDREGRAREEGVGPRSGHCLRQRQTLCVAREGLLLGERAIDYLRLCHILDARWRSINGCADTTLPFYLLADQSRRAGRLGFDARHVKRMRFAGCIFEPLLSRQVWQSPVVRSSAPGLPLPRRGYDDKLGMIGLTLTRAMIGPDAGGGVAGASDMLAAVTRLNLSRERPGGGCGRCKKGGRRS
ncbi:hypothetical protein CH063_07924 [Colletotrichum higginsianum]|uniref:Uncharacterized protein n=1 Tax=Colletotrichum higginsianum (strain IMI 349063) TaxID=759273 RepID=H1V7X8_COLHI|nr:hypothetical protein CH063_07924 [Colletotrichum higginsianum]